MRSVKAVLDGFAHFLRKRDLARPKQRPHLVRWVQEFLLFAQSHGGYTFEQTRDLFLAALGKRGGIEPWQIRQASDALRIVSASTQNQAFIALLLVFREALRAHLEIAAFNT